VNGHISSGVSNGHRNEKQRFRDDAHVCRTGDLLYFFKYREIVPQGGWSSSIRSPMKKAVSRVIPATRSGR